MKGKHPFPWLYLILAYALAWLFWIPVALTGQDYQSSPILLLAVMLGVFGPGIAGIVMTYREQGRAGGRDFWRRLFDFRRIGPGWYALILLLMPGLGILSVLVHSWIGGKPPTFDFLRQAVSQPFGVAVFVILYLLQAGLEELGWRGYMLDRAQAIWKPVTASLVVGICHAFWHLPLFWVSGTNQIKMGFGFDFGLFIVTVLATSILFTWCYNSNQRSTLAVILFHTVGNLSLDTFMLPGAGVRIYNSLVVLAGVTIAAAWLARPRTLTNRLTSVAESK